ncbi:2-C-methyl-D-erythritol 2,4-cyclodiphosphate synthase [Anaerohalosphaera lusitana]|uniref:2-C-methyl-D-erythritol 2,4-cyclodiphosphate synthase n=1 Tax=Anaerohalosphaera lusitana TaxID=1936003 RepID=A0A1U9NIS9_9BACT|nr:2-C-methyl-D-erythritol 2,4-cyclodiphosphate synthase [Anaerohalosphaera lusitana]AQT67634.1 2-C-methyl-D-erythritol 2,4-cyclodiphosphate synthase [Anaerohalosphaera lusitana]
MNLDLKYEYRTGIGTDIHKLVLDRELKLGGVEVPYPKGLLGHSDGDVVLHAVIDAVLGAMCAGDIGTLFPDTDAKYKGIDSKALVLLVRDLMEEMRWEVVNVDVIIHAEEPKLGAYKGQIKRCVASLLSADFNNVNIKAKTNEGLGPVGEGLAIESTVSVLLRRRLKRTLADS